MFNSVTFGPGTLRSHLIRRSRAMIMPFLSLSGNFILRASTLLSSPDRLLLFFIFVHTCQPRHISVMIVQEFTVFQYTHSQPFIRKKLPQKHIFFSYLNDRYRPKTGIIKKIISNLANSHQMDTVVPRY